MKEADPSAQSDYPAHTTYPYPARLCDVLHDFKLSTCTVSPAAVLEGQHADVILSTLRNGCEIFNSPNSPVQGLATIEVH